MDIKKYWWVLAIILVLLFLLLVSNKSSSKEKSGCKKLSYDDWMAKKSAIYKTSKNWDVAHALMLDQGYCEHKE